MIELTDSINIYADVQCFFSSDITIPAGSILHGNILIPSAIKREQILELQKLELKVEELKGKLRKLNNG